MDLPDNWLDIKLCEQTLTSFFFSLDSFNASSVHFKIFQQPLYNRVTKDYVPLGTKVLEHCTLTSKWHKQDKDVPRFFLYKDRLCCYAK